MKQFGERKNIMGLPYFILNWYSLLVSDNWVVSNDCNIDVDDKVGGIYKF